VTPYAEKKHAGMSKESVIPACIQKHSDGGGALVKKLSTVKKSYDIMS